MYRYLKKKAQSTAEYVIILGLIVGAVVAMQTYIKRGMQGRMRNVVDTTDDAGAEIVTYTGKQYEPYYLKSDFDSKSEAKRSEKYHDSGAVNRDIEYERTQRNGTQQILAGDASEDSEFIKNP